VAVGAIWWLTMFRDPLAVTGALLTIAGVAFLFFQLRWQRRQETTGVTPSIAFYRAQLERRRDFHRGKLFWSRMVALTPGPLLFLAGFAREHPEVIDTLRIELAAFIVLYIAAIVLNLGLAARYQRRLNALDQENS
ncbi:MAG TPA: hypothetical protein VJZ00_04960, partial [Thermoanaerobaculia bacterium]|nr:hypothetical protein [Thermoanaerobaculia bacterium]